MIPKEGPRKGPEAPEDASGGNPEDDLQRGPEGSRGSPRPPKGSPRARKAGPKVPSEGAPQAPRRGLVTVSKGATKVDRAHRPGGPGTGESTMRQGLHLGLKKPLLPLW